MSSASRTPAATPAIPRGVGTPPTLLVAGFVLLLTLGVTWLAWERVGAHDALAIRADFDFRARDVEKRISQRMNAYEQVLRGAAGLFTGSRVVSRTDFRDYVAALRLQEHHPGIQGVGFALLVPASDLARHTSEVQREGFPGYAIRPPGPRDAYTSIVFLEPFDGRNLRAFGYDMFSEPVRREAMERALADGNAALSGRAMLVQETDADVQAGVLLYLPVFRKGTAGSSVGGRRERLLGWVYMPFRMNDLAVGVLGERGPELATAIYDGDGATSAGLLFDSEKANGGRTPALDHLEARQTILVAGRPWTLVVQSLPPYRPGLGSRARSGPRRAHRPGHEPGFAEGKCGHRGERDPPPARHARRRSGALGLERPARSGQTCRAGSDCSTPTTGYGINPPSKPPCAGRPSRGRGSNDSATGMDTGSGCSAQAPW